MDAVSTLNEVLNGVDDRQASPHIRFKSVLGVFGACNPLQSFVARLRVRSRNFVGRHHANGRLKDFLVDPCHRLAGGVVYEQGIFQIQPLYS